MSLPGLPARDPGGHKGTFGTVSVVGGCADPARPMLGAPVLAATAAVRAGAGLVRLCVPSPLLIPALSACPSATGVALPAGEDGAVIGHEAAEVLDSLVRESASLVVGPGLGIENSHNNGRSSLVLRALAQDEVPVVLDADGLNTLASVPDPLPDVRAGMVLTPHPREFERLAGGLGLRVSGDREQDATALAQLVGGVVVLKGAGTVVSDGMRSWVCTSGHHCLATGGTGDVLAGVIGGLAAQFVRCETPIPGRERGLGAGPLSLYEAAVLGVEIHARAGERWAKQHGGGAGLLAMELCDLVPGVMAGMGGSH